MKKYLYVFSLFIIENIFTVLILSIQTMKDEFALETSFQEAIKDVIYILYTKSLYFLLIIYYLLSYSLIFKFRFKVNVCFKYGLTHLFNYILIQNIFMAFIGLPYMYMNFECFFTLITCSLFSSLTLCWVLNFNKLDVSDDSRTKVSADL